MKLFLLFFIISLPGYAQNGLYQGKMIDASTQWPVKKYSLSKLSQIIKDAGISKAGIYINSYQPQKSDVEKSTREIKADNLFFIGAPKYFHFESNVTAARTKSLLEEIKKNDYRFISEIMIRHADKKQGLKTLKGERTIDPTSPGLDHLISEIGKLFPGMPILIHWEFYQWDKDIALMNTFFKQYPNQKFVLNHMGYGSPEQIETLLKNHSNLYFTISKRNEKFNYFLKADTFQGKPLLTAKGALDEDWKKILVKHSAKFLFATDSHKDYMWDDYKRIVNDYRKVLFQLPSETADLIARKNTEQLFAIKI